MDRAEFLLYAFDRGHLPSAVLEEDAALLLGAFALARPELLES
jgi:hypothetical protein